MKGFVRDNTDVDFSSESELIVDLTKRGPLSLCRSRINSGFEEQLRLYEALQCEVDTSSPLYKQYRLQKITEKYPGTTQIHTRILLSV